MKNESAAQAVICIHEDRAHCLTGMKLTVLSLRRHCPKIPILLHCPTAPDTFTAWISRVPGVEVMTWNDIPKSGWNVKADILLKLLGEGHRNVIWVDADILAVGDVLTRLAELSPDTLGATEETFWGQSQGGTDRATAWGLAPGRPLPTTVNTGVLRVTGRHLDLLRDWQRMLKHPLYRRAQSLPWYERPLHMISDQEVLTGLLCSHEYAHVNLHLLRRGVDIAQCMGPGGFAPSERVRSLFFGCPGLLHSMAIKPWTKAPAAPPLAFNAYALRLYYEYLHMELTPYTLAAAPFREALDEDARWMDPATLTSKVMLQLAGNNAILAEFPLALIDSLTRRLRRWLSIGRYSLLDEFKLSESPLSQGLQPD